MFVALVPFSGHVVVPNRMVFASFLGSFVTAKNDY